MGGKRKQRAHERRMMEMTQAQLDEQKEEKAIQRKILEKQKEQYRQFQFRNPYADMENQFEGMTVDTRAANFAMQQANQQRADLMQNLRGAAGAIDMTERGGAAMVQSAEMGRQSTLLGIEYGGMAGASAGVQAAYSNQMSAMGMVQQGMSSRYAAGMQMLGTAVGAAIPPSDRKLKKNINKIGESPSGLNIYSFEYKNSIHGKGLFQGVMSDEIPQEAVGTRGGYDTVDYSMLDVEFKQI